MRKLLFSLAMLTVAIVRAQAPDYNDLTILYADKNYEKLVKVADKYVNAEKTKKDPIPCLWAARGLYQISLSGTTDEKFKNAYKDALGYMGKCAKLDPSGALRGDYEEFYNEFEGSLVERIKNDCTGDYKKAAGWVGKYLKLYPNSVGGKYLEAACKFQAADKTGANTLWKDAEKKLTALTTVDGMTPAELQILKMGIIETVNCYQKQKQLEKAKTLLGKVAQYFEGDEEFKTKYDEVVN
jgi:hypothetical protein